MYIHVCTCTVYYNFRLVGEWDPDFRKYLKTLDEKKPVVLCGDLNVAHHEIGREIYMYYDYSNSIILLIYT